MWNGTTNFTETEIGFSYASGAGYSSNNFGSIGLHRGNGAVTETASNTINSNRTYVYSVIASNTGTTPTSVGIFLDGSQYTSIDFGAGLSNGFYSSGSYPIFTNGVYLGARNDRGPINNYLAGDIAEVIFYTRMLSSNDRQRIEGYLLRKWVLGSNIPSTHPFSRVLTGTAPFNPRQISNCRAWFDAADFSTITTSNNFVTLWRDKSGRGFDLSQTNATWRPTYSNSTSEIVFNGSTATGNHLANAALTVSYETHTLFAVHYPEVDISKSTNIFRFQTAGGAYMIFPHITLPGGVARGYVTTANASLNVAASPLKENSTLNSYNIISANISSNSQAVYKNGTLQNSTSFVLTPGVTPRLVVGAWQNTTTPQQPYYGRIRELLIYSSNLSTNDRQLIEGYLAQKWGLQNNLPSTHPFKKISPI